MPYETPEEAARRKQRAMAGRGITAFNIRTFQPDDAKVKRQTMIKAAL